VRKSVIGSAVGVATALALGAAMVPLRSHLSIATTGLVLVVPVVAGVIAGGYLAGVVSVVFGFLVFDYVFIPPYYKLTVGAAQNWVALGVYAVVMLLVAQVVAHLDSARSQAQQRAAEARRLSELSELLVDNRNVDELLATIVNAVKNVFGVSGVTLLLPHLGRLTIAASAGEPISADDLRKLDSVSGVPVPVGTAAGRDGELRTVALATSGRPVAMLALAGVPVSGADRALLRSFANHAAFALERAQLREQATKSELLEEIDRLRRALVGAVSHDLRTPLATMKVASSTLLDPQATLSGEDTHELHSLIDVQTDRLTHLVSSLLDMTRYQAGVLTVERTDCAVLDLVGDALAGIRPTLGDRAVDVTLPESLPQVSVDHLLISQVLANLLDNADRHAPPETPIAVTAQMCGDRVAVAVSDSGPGVPRGESEAVFDSFVRFDTGGRAGLGLAIAKTFVEAHGERIWVEDQPNGGARFVFTMPVAASNGHRE
jgi:two-component system sensor histidine kinase KdpD